jgi:ribosomal protein S18 acetylase RimI-like enzyme
MGKDVTIRRATTADAPELARMCEALHAHMVERDPRLWRKAPDWIAERQATYQAFVTAKEHGMWVAAGADGTVLLGYLVASVAQRADLDPSRFGQIAETWVEPAARRRGVCRALVRAACGWFREQELTQVFVRYAQLNEEAKATWLALGFHEAVMTSNADLDTVEQALGRE